MTLTLKLVIFGVLAALSIAILIEAFLRRNRPRRPLSDLRPKTPANSAPSPGMEATNAELVARAHRANVAHGQRSDLISFGPLRARSRDRASDIIEPAKPAQEKNQ